MYHRPLIALVLFAVCGTHAPATPPETIPASSPFGEAVAYKNISYVANPTPRQNFDLYLPTKKSDKPYPVIIWIHGGAWMSGSKDWINVKYLIRHGYAIASVDYRFSPDAKFPAQIQDCNAALNFILTHAGDYGIDPKRFVVAGGSAGGHLALLLGLARQEKNFGADPAVKPLAILDFFGPADFNKMLDDLRPYHSDKDLQLFLTVVPQLLGVPVDQVSETARIASPVNYVGAASCPVLILHGAKDSTVPLPQSSRLHDALDKAGVKNQLLVVPSAGHDGPLFSTPEIETQVVDFLKVYVPDL